MADIGRARTPAAPDTDGRARTPAAPQMDVVVAPGMCALPSRKPLDHRGPLWVDVSDAIYFITIAAAERGGTMLIDNADTIMNAARFYQDKAKWFLYLFLIMPDHIHMLVHVPPTSQLSDVIGHWKSYLATQKGIRFQVNFFDTRIRDAAHYAEKWNYICQNPVARGLVEAPREWKPGASFSILLRTQTSEPMVKRILPLGLLVGASSFRQERTAVTSANAGSPGLAALVIVRDVLALTKS